MILEILVENPKIILKLLAGREHELRNGNLVVGTASNVRMEHGKLIADGVIPDMMLFTNYGSKAFVSGFAARVRE